MLSQLSVCLVFVIFAFGCSSDSSNPIHFVIPNGFKGKIDIVLDAQNGVSLTKHEGRVLCLVPSNGQIRVRSLSPFQAWHVETASFADGSQILPSSSSSISLFSLGSYASSSTEGNTTQGVTYFVGTKEEAERLKY